MAKIIAYNDSIAGRCITFPTPQTYQAIDNGEMTIEDVARLSVPAGRPFAIIDTSELPSDWASRDAWYIEDDDLADGIGGNEGVPAHGLFKTEEDGAA